MNLIQVRICEGLARHFRLPKLAVSAQVKAYFETVAEMDSPVFEVNIKGNCIVLGASRQIPKPNQLWKHSKFLKTELYTDVEDYVGNNGAHAVCFYSGGALLAITKESVYSGMGGLLIKSSSDSKRGYVIELLENYLERTYPVYNEE